ncbi:cysteine-rich receptor-like protein kinase 15 [Cryptomeria japonica]|uniref:cysteine-rich receptor-like protein kinase 15 n=1 Tax=Cryptomeria japonica TaxID=3369 RepID=UPI0027DA9B91|nr:cysteine-rich receptor-like protein kinase 15 [Cryptomeria japonica]
MQMAWSAIFPHSLRVLLFVGITVLFIAQLVPICNGQIKICNGNTNTSTKFRSNLNIVLNNLVDNTSSSNGFNISTSGQGADKASGLLQCLGDVSREECLNCSREANTTVRNSCKDAIGARVWLDNCYIRYENYPFGGQLSIDGQVDPGTAKALGDPNLFSAAVKALLQNLSDEALGSPGRYSSGQTNASVTYQTFGFVQCWKDVTNVSDCNSCLSTAIKKVLDATENGTRLGAVAGLGSCMARFSSVLLPPTPKKSSNKVVIVLGILGGLLVVLLLCLFAFRRKLKSVILGKPEIVRRDADMDSVFSQEPELVFTLENIKVATRNFDEDNKLGEGGFGSVYKGTMPDGKQIAVKKLSLKSSQGKVEFLNEVKLVAKIQHRNLVNLLGCCAEGSERLLVYEFLVNTSLDKILFHPERKKVLDWNRRLNIICGVGRGLLYLHEDSQLKIIHRDIKASNILLNEKLEPKISDFGLARLVGQDETFVNTKVAGTYGYMAPEYAMLGHLSAKADIYSFGIVILEIICGRKNTDVKLFPEFRSQLDRVWRYYSKGNIIDIIDKDIVESITSEQVSRYIHIGLLCTQEDASIRPPMVNVYAMLSNPSITDLPEITKPAYLKVAHKDVLKHTHNPTSPKSETSVLSNSFDFSINPSVYPSINDESITDLGPR